MRHIAQARLRPAARIGAVSAAVALIGAFLMLAPSATAANGDGNGEPDPVTLQGCTITVPAVQAIIYYAGEDEIEPGTYDAAEFYPREDFRAQLGGDDSANFGPWAIEIPVECLVDVSVTCDNTVTFTKLGGFDWGTLSIEWSREDGVDHGAHQFNDGDSVTTKPSGFPLYYEITEGEMDQGVSGEVEAPDCEQPAQAAEDPPEEDPHDPEPVTPSKAPASGL